MPTTATATLSRITSNGRREACLTIDWAGGFVGARIEVGQQWGGAFASEEVIRAQLLKNAQARADYEANTHGLTIAPIVWES